MRVAFYRVLYGLDFLRESIESIYPHVDRIIVFHTNRVWGDCATVQFEGKEVIFPDCFEAIPATINRS